MQVLHQVALFQHDGPQGLKVVELAAAASLANAHVYLGELRATLLNDHAKIDGVEASLAQILNFGAELAVRALPNVFAELCLQIGGVLVLFRLVADDPHDAPHKQNALGRILTDEARHHVPVHVKFPYWRRISDFPFLRKTGSLKSRLKVSSTHRTPWKAA